VGRISDQIPDTPARAMPVFQDKGQQTWIERRNRGTGEQRRDAEGGPNLYPVGGRAADLVGWLAASLIFLMVGVLLLDAVTRNVLHIPLHWCVESRSSRSPHISFSAAP
jgi:hypothetical protein